MDAQFNLLENRLNLMLENYGWITKIALVCLNKTMYTLFLN